MLQLGSPQGLLICGAAHDEHDRLFSKGLGEICGKIKTFPIREDLTESDNIKYDAQRLDLIIYSLRYLQIYSPSVNQLIEGQSTDTAKVYLEGLALYYKRYIFKAVSYILYNTSGEFRGKYKGYLSPAPFSWETFEHFGAVMTDHSHERVIVFQDTSAPESTQNAMREHYNKEVIVEAAVDLIIKEDLNKLLEFFRMLKADQSSSSTAPPVELKIYQFFAIKALTKRITDTSTFMCLLNLTNNLKLERSMMRNVPSRENDGNDFNLSVVLFPKTFTPSCLILDTEMKIHAALRRLEMIGEFLTGKYFSTEWKAIDDSVDWNAIATLRDGIAHQDEADNYSKLQRILREKDLLQNILEIDLPCLHHRLHVMCARKQSISLQYKKGAEDEFCSTLIQHEKDAYTKTLSVRDLPKPIEQKVKLTKEERAKKREADIAAAAARRQEAADKLQGLNYIRRAASILAETGSGSCDTLNMKKRVELALGALTNIDKFLKKSKIFVSKHTDLGSILKAVYQDEILYDAINYNVEQFIQHLDRIKSLDLIKNSLIIIENYDNLRCLRNHIAHGALLLDTEEFRPGQKSFPFTIQQQRVAVAIRKLLCEFPALLRKALANLVMTTDMPGKAGNPIFHK